MYCHRTGIIIGCKVQQLPLAKTARTGQEGRCRIALCPPELWLKFQQAWAESLPSSLVAFATRCVHCRALLLLLLPLWSRFICGPGSTVTHIRVFRWHMWHGCKVLNTHPFFSTVQVSVLTDQVEAQGEKIRDLEFCLEEHREKLNATEEMLQQVFHRRVCVSLSVLILSVFILNRTAFCFWESSALQGVAPLDVS